MKRPSPHLVPPLASFERAWTDAAFDAIYPEPPRSVLPHGVASMRPARFFDGVLASIPLEQSLGLRVTLWMIALAPLFTIRKLGTIASISPDDRVRVLEHLLASSNYFVRQLTMSLKAMATLLYARSDVVRASMSTPVPSAPRAGADFAPPRSEEPLISAERLTSRAKVSIGGARAHAAE